MGGAPAWWGLPVSSIAAGRVVLTTGTFLKGVIHLGQQRIPAGRMKIGDAPAIGLADRLYGLGLRMGRLKTGTPARLDGKTIDWDVLEMQAADAEPVPFSFLTDKITTPQIACGITWTNADPPDYRRPARRIRRLRRTDRDRAWTALLPLHRGQGRPLRRQDEPPDLP
jgi:hypothetical protein